MPAKEELSARSPYTNPGAAYSKQIGTRCKYAGYDNENKQVGKELSVIAKRFVAFNLHLLTPETPMFQTHCQQRDAFYRKDHHRDEYGLDLPESGEKAACMFPGAPSEFMCITNLVIGAVEIWDVSESDSDHKRGLIREAEPPER
jgi:hypothetical protein